MAYNKQRKYYVGELLEIDISKTNFKNKLDKVGIVKGTLDIEGVVKPCTLEGLKVGYGVRLYFRCSFCDTRVSKLYTSRKPSQDSDVACRHCIGMNYISQQATKTDLGYEFHLMNKLGRKVDPNFIVESIDTPFPVRRKYMNKHKYFELRVKYTSVQLKAREKFIRMCGAILNK